MADKTHNLTDLKKIISDAIKSVGDLKLDRADINAEIQSVRANLVTHGIPKKAFDMALSYINMDPDDREGFDVAYALVREAGGLPMQEDLFSAADRLGRAKVEEEEAANKKQAKGPDAAGIEKVIKSQEDNKTKGKTVHASSTGSGTIN